MEAFREMVTGWLGKTLLMLMTVPFALFGVYSYLDGGGSRALAAEVNGKPIYQADFDKALQSQKAKVLQQLGPTADPSKIDEQKLRKDVLKLLVNQELLTQDANQHGFLVSDSYIAKLIEQEPGFKDENGKFSTARYTDALRRAGEDPATFPTKAKAQIATAELVSGLNTSAFATATDVTRLATLDGQKRDLHVAQVNVAAFTTGLTSTDDEAKKFYDANPKRFTAEERVSLDYIQLNRDDFLAQATVSDDDINARYAEQVKALAANEQRHAQHILITVDPKVKTSNADALKKIQDIEKRARAGEDFGALAKQFSQDPGSAVNNGDLGFAGHGQFVPEFDKVLYDLQPNQISAPVKTQFGYHLIKLLEVRKATIPTLAEMRPGLEQQVKAAKAAELYADAVEKIDTAVYEAADLKDPAAKFKLAIQGSDPITRTGTQAGIANNASVIKAAFSDDLIKDGKNSNSIKFDDAHTLWLHARNYQPAHLQAYAEVSAQAHSLVVLEKAGVKARAAADAAAKDLNGGKALADVGLAFQLQWQDLPGIDHRAAGLNPDELRAAFTLPAPAEGKTSAKAVPLGDNFAVIAVTRVIPGEATPVGPELSQMTTVVGESIGQLELADYVEYLRAKATIKTFDSKKVAAQ
jgi:peptidyl-prolyl cis-trans isomerase D